MACLPLIRYCGIVKPRAALRCCSRLYNAGISDRISSANHRFCGFLLAGHHGHERRNIHPSVQQDMADQLDAENMNEEPNDREGGLAYVS